MRLLEDSQFVVALVVTQAILGFLSSASLALQGEACDQLQRNAFKIKEMMIAGKKCGVELKCQPHLLTQLL